MKVCISKSFSYGGASIDFYKEFELPFAPYYDLGISEGDEEHQLETELRRDEYIKSYIYWDVLEGEFQINIREKLNKMVSNELIDELIELHIYFEWEMVNDNSETIKALANQQK